MHEIQGKHATAQPSATGNMCHPPALDASAPDGIVLLDTFSATETAHSLSTMDSVIGTSPRIYGMAWGAEDLVAVQGASTNRAPGGE